jgi:sortase A
MMALRTALRSVPRLLIWLGVSALVCASGALAYASAYQRYESWKLQQVVAADRIALAATEDDPVELREGDPIGKLDIPRIGISVIVLHGVDDKTLILGAGHVPGTPRPGTEGNFVIAGHRDTFFRAMERIEAGDTVRFSTAHDTYEYVVESTEIVGPEHTYVMESHARAELTLITCYPFSFVGGAPERFVVRARPR